MINDFFTSSLLNNENCLRIFKLIIARVDN